MRSRIALTEDAVDTQYGTVTVSAIRHSLANGTSPRRMASPWLMAINNEPTPMAYERARRTIGGLQARRNHSVTRRLFCGDAVKARVAVRLNIRASRVTIILVQVG